MRVEKIGLATLYLGDCEDVLPALPDSCIESVVTDPPYGIGFMGKRWDYDVPQEKIWRECLRGLQPGGHLLSFSSTRTHHRMAVRIEDAGFEIRDMIAWVYGSGFPKSHNLQGEWQGFGTALKPAMEPITVARKPLIGTVARNVLAHGTGALNIDGCRVGAEGGTRWVPTGDKGDVGQFGGGIKDGAVADAGNGRWPANLIHDGSEDVLGLFPVTQSGAIAPHHHRASPRHKFAYKGGVRQHVIEDYPKRQGSAARLFYCAKASTSERDEGVIGLPKRTVGVWGGEEDDLTEGKSRVVPVCNDHPTVKPIDLMRYLCRLVTPPRGVVLDPFMGSGSTGRAAIFEEFSFIGIEREERYFDIACRRIEEAQRQGDMFRDAVA
jgi:DNA modification methylase